MFEFKIDKETVEQIENQVAEVISSQEETLSSTNMITTSYLYRTGLLTSKFSKEKQFIDVE